MSKSKDVAFNLKAVINKQKTRVLFAEVENDFVDVLFSFLILPLGNIVRVLKMHYGDKAPDGIGSLNTLYDGLTFFQLQIYVIKRSIFNTESRYAFPYFELRDAYFIVLRIFTEKKASFIISDDLRIVPNGKGSIVQTLNSVGVEMSDMDGAETRNVTFGLNEIMDFLKGLFISSQPLTDIILGGTPEKSETGIPLHKIEKEAASNSTKIYDLKLMLQKSTKKLLFAQAEKDFVSFLSTILEIPLGIVDSNLGGNTCLNKIGCLYRSIIDLVDHKYINAAYQKDSLTKSETFSYNHLLNFDTDAEGYKMYMVTDDLFVKRLCASSALSLLNQMKISSSDVEEVELHIGLEEACNILKASLASTSALSDGLVIPMLKTQRKVKQEH